jgi:NADH-quinone oxidoreductase subunit A
MNASHIYEGYLPLFIVIALALTIGCVILLLNKLLSYIPLERTPKKYDTYECGVPYEGSATQQFSVRYYLIGIIFLLFDVEVVFLYPWASVFRDLVSHGFFVLWEMLFFVVILFAGYLYLRLRGALNWD